MKRGDVYLVSLDPVVGSETGKTRPAIVVQNDLANRSSLTVTVIPVTSRADQKRRLGQLPSERLQEIRTALDRHLWFEV